MQKTKVSGALFALTALVCLSGCDDIGAALGMNHAKPDEGPVTTNQPLALPPDYTLKPPRETAKGTDPQSTDHPASTDPDLEKHH